MLLISVCIMFKMGCFITAAFIVYCLGRVKLFGSFQYSVRQHISLIFIWSHETLTSTVQPLMKDHSQGLLKSHSPHPPTHPLLHCPMHTAPPAPTHLPIPVRQPTENIPVNSSVHSFMWPYPSPKKDHFFFTIFKDVVFNQRLHCNMYIRLHSVVLNALWYIFATWEVSVNWSIIYRHNWNCSVMSP